MVAAACSPFTSEDVPRKDAGGAGAGDAGAEAGAGDEGGAPDAGCAGGGPVISDPLDATAAPWVLTGTGLTFVNTDARSNGRALHLALSTASASSSYARPIAVGACSFQVAVAVRFGTIGSGEIDFVAVSEPGVNGRAFSFVHRNNPNDFVLEPPGSGPVGLPTPTTAVWHDLTIQVLRAKRTVALSIDGQPGATVPMPDGWGNAGIELRLGAPYVGSPGTWSVDFDDVVVSLLP